MGRRSGWVERAVESEWGTEGGLSWPGTEWGGCSKVFLNNCQDLHGSFLSFFQTLKDKGEGVMLQ
jgi:hypothetical protein